MIAADSERNYIRNENECTKKKKKRTNKKRNAYKRAPITLILFF